MNALIRNTPSLTEVCTQARTGGLLSLDTEFVWNTTFMPRLGLVQLAEAAGGCYALDCLLGTDPAALGAVLADAAVVKILHYARQDLILLHQYTGALPHTIFDTQLAAAFAGFTHGIGLQRLLKDVLGVNLPKTETRTNWTQRPLTPQQVAYALDDVRYLIPLRKALLARADELGTRAWLEEDLALYDNPQLYATCAIEEAWYKVKCGGVVLDGAGRARLRALAGMREHLARQWNMPRMWLGDDPSLVELAMRPPRNGVVRFRHRLRNRGQRDTVAAYYTQALIEADSLPESEWPAERHLRYPQEVREQGEAALEFLRERAVALHVAAPILATRDTVKAFLYNPEDETNPLAHGWRYEVAGREVLARFPC